MLRDRSIPQKPHEYPATLMAATLALPDPHLAVAFSSHRSDKIAIERVLPAENWHPPRRSAIPRPISHSHLIETAATRFAKFP
jgi:hypothetical protein